MATIQNYNPNIPQSTDLLSKSQNDLLLNFQALELWLDVNHVDSQDATDAGKHKFVTFTDQTANPTGGGTDLLLFNRLSAITPPTGLQELCFRRNASATIIEITAAANTTNGWTYWPSGMLIQWGVATWPGAGVAFINVTFPKQFGIIPYSIQVTPMFPLPIATGSDALFVSNGTPGTAPTTTIFQIRSSIGTNYVGKTVYWMAIGSGF